MRYRPRRAKNAPVVHVPPAFIESLEARCLLSTAPGSVITKANRQTLLSGMNLSATLKNSLQAKLNSNDLAGFDTSLLSYSNTRTNAHFFFDVADSGTIATYIKNNIGDGGAQSRADSILSHIFPEQSDATTYTVNVGSTIDWTSKAPSSNQEFLHALNRQGYWMDLSQAYRFTGNAAYANEQIGR